MNKLSLIRRINNVTDMKIIHNLSLVKTIIELSITNNIPPRSFQHSDFIHKNCSLQHSFVVAWFVVAHPTVYGVWFKTIVAPPAKSLASVARTSNFAPSVCYAYMRYDSNTRLSLPSCVSNSRLQDVTMMATTLPGTAWFVIYASEQCLALSSLRNTDQPLVFIIDGL